MIIIDPFDPTAISAGVIQATTVNRCGVLYLINESNVALRLDLGAGNIAVLPPWFTRAYKMPLPRQPVNWTVLYVLNAASSPISIIHGEVYEPSEVDINQLPQGPLVRQLNVGNTINTNAQNMATLQNDGAAALTQIIEITQIGSSGSNLFADNSGNLYVAEFVGGVYNKLLQVIAGGSPTVVKLGRVGRTVEVLDQLNVDGGAFLNGLTLNNAKIFGTGGWTWIDFSDNVNFKVIPNGGNLAVTGGFTVSGTTSIQGLFVQGITSSAGKIFGTGGWVWFDFSGTSLVLTPNGGTVKVNSASLQFTDGSLLNRIHGFTGTGSGTFNHNNGQTPNNVQLTCHAVGSTQTMGYDSENGTTLHISTGAGLGWTGIAFSLS